MSRIKKSLITAMAVLPLFCAAVFAQPRPAVNVNVNLGGGSAAVGVSANSSGAGNAVAAYVFGEENSKNAEDLAEAVVNNLVGSGKYTQPRRGAREFFRAVDREQARNRGRMLEDRNFCRIGGDEGVQFLVIIDIEKAGRGNSVWARLLDLDQCRIIGTAEYTGLIRNNTEIRSAAKSLTDELIHRRVGRRGGGGSAPPPPPPPPPPRGNQIAGYVFGMEEARLGEELADAIVSGLTNSRTYSAPRRGARDFFRMADREQAKKRGALLADRDFCKIGTDFEIEYLVIIDIERRGRGNSVWARILDLETCRIIATGESTALIRNDAEVKAVANEIVGELLRRRIGTRR